VGHNGISAGVDVGSDMEVDTGGNVDTDVIVGDGVEIEKEVDFIRHPVFTNLLYTRSVVLISVSVICFQTPQKALQLVDGIGTSHELATHCAMLLPSVTQA